MRSESICIFFTLIVTISTIDEDVSLSSITSKVISNKISSQRRKSNLFPKSVKKFVITSPASIIKPVYLKKTATSRSLMKKITPIFRTTEAPFRYTRPMSRKPFMKIKKFTIDLSTKSWQNENIQRNHDTSDSSEESFYNSGEHNLNSEVSDEIKNEEDHATVIDEIDDGFTQTTKSTLLGKIRKPLNRIQALDSKRIKRNEEINTINFDNYNTEEAEDYKEFIFLPKTQFQSMQRSDDLFSNPSRINSLSDDKTSRSKRSINNNIIEEEEFGSTIYGFKFTARPSETATHSRI